MKEEKKQRKGRKAKRKQVGRHICSSFNPMTAVSTWTMAVKALAGSWRKIRPMISGTTKNEIVFEEALPL